MKNFLSLFIAACAILIALATANAQKPTAGGCPNVPSESQLRQLLVQAQNLNKPIGGLSKECACGPPSSTAMARFAPLTRRPPTRRRHGPAVKQLPSQRHIQPTLLALMI